MGKENNMIVDKQLKIEKELKSPSIVWKTRTLDEETKRLEEHIKKDPEMFKRFIESLKKTK